MKTIKKSEQITVRVTEKQKEFLTKQMDEEQRSLTTIMNIALGEKYPEYKEITKGKGD